MALSSHNPDWQQRDAYSSGISASDQGVPRMSPEEQETARRAAQYGWGPFAQTPHQVSPRFSAAQTATYNETPAVATPANVPQKNIANPAPLGWFAFALTAFLFSLINLGTRHLRLSNIVIGPALGYGGLVQLLTGMWEVALGNTFNATALSSFGGFWISTAIILTPGGFQINATYQANNDPDGFEQGISLYLFGWTILTFFLLLCTLKTSVPHFALFALWTLTYLFLACAYQNCNATTGAPNTGLQRGGGAFGILAAFTAWYIGMVDLLDAKNSFFTLPVLAFPWSSEENQQASTTTSNGARSEKTHFSLDKMRKVFRK